MDKKETLKEIMARCEQIHQEREPVRIKMDAGTASDAEIDWFSRQQDKSLDLMRQAFAGRFRTDREGFPQRGTEGGE